MTSVAFVNPAETVMGGGGAAVKSAAVETAVLSLWKVCAASGMLIRIDPNARSHSTFCYSTFCRSVASGADVGRYDRIFPLDAAISPSPAAAACRRSG